MKKKIDKEHLSQYNNLCSVANKMHEWLSGGVSPCQGEGRGFESRLVLFLCLKIYFYDIELVTNLDLWSSYPNE